VQLLGCGTILREVIAAAGLLAEAGVAADVWSCPSFTELGREGADTDRWNLLHPDRPRRVSFVEQQLGARPGPVVAASDYIRAYPDQIRPHLPAGRRYRVLGTDGYGRSDYRRVLRDHFEVDRRYITLAALTELAADGQIPAQAVGEAIGRLGIDPDKPNPARA
jgi:pyruvate dehydrogenase E1 component